MTDAVRAVQTALVSALEAHPAIAASHIEVYDGPEPRAAFPYISVTDGLVNDWSTKTAIGREFRMALTVWEEGEEAARLHDLMAHVEDAVAALPRDLPGWRVASIAFVRSFVTRDTAGPWAGLVEYRLRVLATP
jgi:Protein of unknown function (DUF3168)